MPAAAPAQPAFQAATAKSLRGGSQPRAQKLTRGGFGSQTPTPPPATSAPEARTSAQSGPHPHPGMGRLSPPHQSPPPPPAPRPSWSSPLCAQSPYAQGTHPRRPGTVATPLPGPDPGTRLRHQRRRAQRKAVIVIAAVACELVAGCDAAMSVTAVRTRESRRPPENHPGPTGPRRGNRRPVGGGMLGGRGSSVPTTGRARPGPSPHRSRAGSSKEQPRGCPASG